MKRARSTQSCTINKRRAKSKITKRMKKNEKVVAKSESQKNKLNKLFGRIKVLEVAGNLEEALKLQKRYLKLRIKNIERAKSRHKGQPQPKALEDKLNKLKKDLERILKNGESR